MQYGCQICLLWTRKSRIIMKLRYQTKWSIYTQTELYNTAPGMSYRKNNIKLVVFSTVDKKSYNQDKTPPIYLACKLLNWIKFTIIMNVHMTLLKASITISSPSPRPSNSQASLPSEYFSLQGNWNIFMSDVSTELSIWYPDMPHRCRKL